MDKKIKYFAYGANKTPEMMEAITGERGFIGIPAILRGYELCVQKLENVPDTISETAPIDVSPRKLLSNSWDDTFESYVVKKGNGVVTGNFWTITKQEREFVRNWELIEFGWYKEVKVKVETESGEVVDAVTEIMGDGQEYDRKVEGKEYKPFLVSKGKIFKVAKKSREAYFFRREAKIRKFGRK